MLPKRTMIIKGIELTGVCLRAAPATGQLLQRPSCLPPSAFSQPAILHSVLPGMLAQRSFSLTITSPAMVCPPSVSL